MGQRRFVADRCRDCGLHEPLCVCEHRPRLELGLDLLIVQANKERNKPTNTGRMLPQLLVGAELLHYGARGVAFDDAPLRRPDRDYWLIFPRVDDPEGVEPRPAPVLEAGHFAAARAAAPGRVATVVLLDGTWAQCSRMSRRIPAIAKLSAWALPQGPGSHWGVRTASEPGRLSTFEAAIRVVELLDDRGRAGQMQRYFDRIAAGMLHMKAKLPSPEVPASWDEQWAQRFGPRPDRDDSQIHVL